MNTPMYDAIYSVDTLNDLIANGMSFRDAYKHIGAQIDAGTFTPNKNVPHTHTSSIGNPGLDLIKQAQHQIVLRFLKTKTLVEIIYCTSSKISLHTISVM